MTDPHDIAEANKKVEAYQKSLAYPTAMAMWHPITDPRHLRHLGKLAEECGELTSALSRCIIQGIDQKEPVTGKVNRDWLEEEIADVEALIERLKEYLALDRDKISARIAKKTAFHDPWFDLK